MLARRYALVSAVAAVVLASGTLPAGATATYSGACALEVEVTFSSSVGRLPSPKTLGISGSGTCVVNGDVAALRIAGYVATTSLTGGFSCAGGVATGTGAVEIDVPGFPGPDVQLSVLEADGVVTVVAVAPTHVLRFNGVATLAEDPQDAAVCAVSGMSATTWVGAMAFQDPYPPPL